MIFRNFEDWQKIEKYPSRKNFSLHSLDLSWHIVQSSSIGLSVDGDPDNYFKINSTSGNVTLMKPFSSAREFQLIIEASDGYEPPSSHTTLVRPCCLVYLLLVMSKSVPPKRIYAYTYVYTDEVSFPTRLDLKVRISLQDEIYSCVSLCASSLIFMSRLSAG